NYTKSLGRNDLVAWVHLENAAGEVTSGLFFGPGLEQRLTKDFLDHTKELLIQSVKVYHKFSSIPVKGLAWVAGGLSDIISLTEIPSTYYDPSLGKAYDPTIFLFYYIGRGTTELGSGVVVNTIVSDDDDFAEKIGGALLKDLGVKQYEFALVTGFWNGIVEELRGVADATEMLCHAYTDPPTIDQVNEVMHSILNGSAFNVIGTQLKDRYTSENFSDYQKLHHAGKDIIAAATLFIGVGEISGAAKVSKAFAGLAKASRTIELISLTRYAFNAAKGVELYKLGSQARMFIRLVGDEPNVVIKVVNCAGDILKNTDFSLLKEVSYSVPGYGTGRGIVFVDPSENLKGAIHEIRQLVTDRYGNKAVEITDDAGKHLGVDAKDPASLLDEGAEIATLLSSLRTKVGEAQWPSFAKDFEKN